LIKNNPGRWKILLPSILLIIFAAIIGGCAETGQKNTVTPQPETNQQNTFTVPKTDREQVNKFLTPREALNLIKSNQNNPYFVIIDDRSAREFSGGHIAKAVNIPASNFTAGVKGMDRNKIYLTYCRTGCGAGSAQMKNLGFKEVYDITGGLDAWMSDGLPVEK
jgi:rhodanese-related sulfurtransferase